MQYVLPQVKSHYQLVKRIRMGNNKPDELRNIMRAKKNERKMKEYLETSS